jgi:rare lipoprotein A
MALSLRYIIISFGFLGLLAGCSTSRDERSDGIDVPLSPQVTITSDATSNYKIGTPYKIAGIQYQPKERFIHEETGQASWYGPGFHSRLTANGEPFDQRAMTAAHRTLQLPSIIHVTNLSNGRTAVLRVNDRGPYHADRILDVSEVAAEELGFMRRGTTKVKIKVLEDPSREVAGLASSNATIKELESIRLAAANSFKAQNSSISRKVEKKAEYSYAARAGTFVQTGAFSIKQNAHKQGLSLNNFGQYLVKKSEYNGKTIFLVRFGPYENVQEAKKALSRFAVAGAKDAHVVTVQ